MVAAMQILAIMCFIKGNPAWKESLPLLFSVVVFEFWMILFETDFSRGLQGPECLQTHASYDTIFIQGKQGFPK